jgi:lysophospholipid acyltransferase (LPLAT)-like uncharacterized protein
MKLRHPWLIGLAATLAAGVIRSWMGAVRPRTALLGPERHPADPRAERYVYAFWHESLLLLTPFRVRASVLISHHADGELIARVCRHLRIGVVRGSTTRGGSAALLELVRRGREAHLAITPDGPRGPRRRVQPGVVSVAALTGLPVVPVGVGCASAWRAGSWDRMLLPRPGSAAHYVAGPAVRVPPGLDRPAMEEYRRLVEDRLLAVTAAAERWAAGGPRPAPELARPLAASA